MKELDYEIRERLDRSTIDKFENQDSPNLRNNNGLPSIINNSNDASYDGGSELKVMNENQAKLDEKLKLFKAKKHQL